MKTLSYLPLNKQQVAPVVNGLAQLLADLQVYYTNLRGFHWNIKGRGFFTLHEKFEGLYNEVAEKVDEVAERILQLDGKPENKFSEYLKTTNVPEVSNVQCGGDAVENILQTLRALMIQERNIFAGRLPPRTRKASVDAHRLCLCRLRRLSSDFSVSESDSRLPNL